MITHRMKVHRQLRSVRASVLSKEERRQELREAEERWGRDHRDEPPESKTSRRSSGIEGTLRPPESEAEEAGLTEAD